MSLTRYFFHDFWTAQELNRVDDRMKRMRKVNSRSRADLRQRIDELEDDLGRVLLFATSLAEVCVKKGLLTREELAAMSNEIDLADGQADGKLDPATLDGGSSRRDERPVSSEEHLRRLESSEQPTTNEFLKNLEGRDRS